MNEHPNGHSLNALPVVMDCWVVYESPRDMPGCWVARRHVVERPGEDFKPTHEHMATSVSYDDLMRMLAPKLGNKVRIPRFPDDKPQIVECWM